MPSQGSGTPASDDRPRLRPLEGHPVERDGQQLLTLHDPSGLSEYSASLPPFAVAVVQLCDGDSTRDEICELFFRRYRQKLARPDLDTLLDQLDHALLLDSPRFRQFATGIFTEFARSTVRSPLHAGRSYPADAKKLKAQLDQYFDPPNGPGRPTVGKSARPRAIVAPHIDFTRGGPAYAWAYHSLAQSVDDPPELAVLLGTDHGGVDHPFTLTRKHYDTPFGHLSTDGELVDHLASVAGGDALFADEYHHRGEHSLEFQAVWLRYLYGSRADSFKVLPILCGSLGEFIDSGADPMSDSSVASFIEALESATRGKKVLWIAGADLAHVGPRYGDDKPITPEDGRSLESRDQATLAHVCRGDANGWFEEIRKERDRRNVCGLSPIYAMLAAANPGTGSLGAYAQCPADPGSVVSIASVVWNGAAASQG